MPGLHLFYCFYHNRLTQQEIKHFHGKQSVICRVLCNWRAFCFFLIFPTHTEPFLVFSQFLYHFMIMQAKWVFSWIYDWNIIEYTVLQWIFVNAFSIHRILHLYNFYMNFPLKILLACSTYQNSRNKEIRVNFNAKRLITWYVMNSVPCHDVGPFQSIPPKNYYSKHRKPLIFKVLHFRCSKSHLHSL
jgi:hypothetical protein